MTNNRSIPYSELTPEQLQQIAQQHQPTSAELQPPVNPLLTKVKIPGQSFTLPSRGLFYSPGVLDEQASRTNEVHVYPLTAIDEIVLKSPDKLFSGDAVVDVFKHRIPAILKPKELAANDVDFLLLALRKVTYGDTFSIEYTHDCEGVEDKDRKMKGSIKNARVTVVFY